MRPGRIRQGKHLADLVESLTRRIVDGRTQDGLFQVVVHPHDLRVSAADGQAQEREMRHGAAAAVFHEIGQDVPLHMVDLDQRDSQRDRKALGKRGAHQKRTHQARSARKSDCGYVLFAYICLSDGSIDHRDDILLVGARSQFGDYAPPEFVDFLRGDDGGKQLRTAHHGRRGVVAGGFDAQDNWLLKCCHGTKIRKGERSGKGENEVFAPRQRPRVPPVFQKRTLSA